MSHDPERYRARTAALDALAERFRAAGHEVEPHFCGGYAVADPGQPGEYVWIGLDGDDFEFWHSDVRSPWSWSAEPDEVFATVKGWFDRGY